MAWIWSASIIPIRQGPENAHQEAMRLRQLTSRGDVSSSQPDLVRPEGAWQARAYLIENGRASEVELRIGPASNPRRYPFIAILTQSKPLA